MPNSKYMTQNFVKAALLRLIRSKSWQPFWQTLHHYSLIGMNFWGGATVSHSGEKYAVRYASSRVSHEKAMVIFDIGANLGQFASMCIENIPGPKRIYSFEPSTRTFQALQKIIHENQYGDVITPIHAGLSDASGKIKLFSSEQNSSIASVYNLRNPVQKFDESLSEEIIVTTIDDFCSEHHIESIDYLKIDIEGHEYKALLGCRRMLAENRIRFIQFEFGEYHLDSRTFFLDFHELLSKQYDIYRIVPNGLVKIPSYSSELEIFATINYLAELK